MNKLLWLSSAVCVGVLALGMTGCEWTSGGGVETWADAGYNWANFSGSYRPPDGGILVREFGVNSNELGTISVTNSSRNEVVGVGDGITTEFSGHIRETPLPGTLTIVVGSYRFTDSTDNSSLATYNLAVTPEDGSSGTINYDTRFWALKFPAPINSGSSIEANYLYLTTEKEAGAGNHGAAIYSFVVYQTGNNVQLVDSNGNVYNGSIGNLSTTGGLPYDPTDPSSIVPTKGNVYAQFSATGSSAGYSVTIAGTLHGELGDDEGRAIINRKMQATFIEVGGFEADINAVSAD